MGFDLVLSSGFLAFARHAGVLRAIERRGDEVTGVCGTSSGALIGALWAAGVSADDIMERVTVQQPMALMRFNWRIWSGLYSLDAVIDQLHAWLPPTFADLPVPFGVGVMDSSGQARLLTSGPLPEAVAASCAIPWLFVPVAIDGESYRDGGAVDRIGLKAWSAWRGDHPTVLHMVDRTGGAKTPIQSIPPEVCVIRTARSGAKFWDLGDVRGQMQEAQERAELTLETSL